MKVPSIIWVCAERIRTLFALKEFGSAIMMCFTGSWGLPISLSSEQPFSVTVSYPKSVSKLRSFSENDMVYDTEVVVTRPKGVMSVDGVPV